MVSRSTGALYEKRLVEKYLREEGKCPVTGAEMTEEDLIEVKGELNSLVDVEEDREGGGKRERRKSEENGSSRLVHSLKVLSSFRPLRGELSPPVVFVRIVALTVRVLHS